jgi:hypothetical protein
MVYLLNMVIFHGELLVITRGYLVGGDWNMFYDFPIIFGISSSQLTNILFRGVDTTNQISIYIYASLIVTGSFAN